MDIKKGLTYVAYGFLFTLININLNFNGTSINIIPDFVGWILFFLAYDKLGTYTNDKSFLKWGFLIMAVYTGVTWILGFTSSEMDLGIINTVFGVLSTVLMFILFGSLEMVAHDYDPAREQTIYMLKMLNLVLGIVFVVFGLIMAGTQSNIMGVLTILIGVALLVLAIYTAFVLFKLRNAVQARIDSQDSI